MFKVNKGLNFRGYIYFNFAGNSDNRKSPIATGAVKERLWLKGLYKELVFAEMRWSFEQIIKMLYLV